MHQNVFVFILKKSSNMNKDEVLDRLREELEIPFFQGKLEEKEYSEADYQKLKQDLLQYFDDYVRNVEN